MTTRRNLLKSSLSLAAAPVGMSVAIEVAHAEDMPKWNNETDVLVLGYGNAGSNAAIAAAEQKFSSSRRRLRAAEMSLFLLAALSFRQTKKIITSSKRRCMNCLALSGIKTFWTCSAKSPSI